MEGKLVFLALGVAAGWVLFGKRGKCGCKAASTASSTIAPTTGGAVFTTSAGPLGTTTGQAPVADSSSGFLGAGDADDGIATLTSTGTDVPASALPKAPPPILGSEQGGLDLAPAGPSSTSSGPSLGTKCRTCGTGTSSGTTSATMSGAMLAPALPELSTFGYPTAPPPPKLSLASLGTTRLSISGTPRFVS